MPSSFTTTFSNKDNLFIYPEVYLQAGVFQSFKPNNLNTYAVTDFSVNIPALCMITSTATTTFSSAWANNVANVNAWITTVGQTNICVKFLGVEGHSFSATSHTCTMFFAVNRL